MMSDARPLLKTGSQTERTLLAAGAAERPAMADVRRAAKGVGLFPRVALVGIAMGMALRAARWSSVAFWGAIPLAGVVGLALVSYETRLRPSPSGALPSFTPVHWPLAEATAVSTPALASSAPMARSPSATDSIQAPVGSPRPRARASGHSLSMSVPAGVTPESLGDQSRLLDRARVSLASGDARSSLALLDLYDRRFVGKALREEALLLRIEALARHGERASALALSQQFARSYPASVHGDRLAALIHTLSQ